MPKEILDHINTSSESLHHDYISLDKWYIRCLLLCFAGWFVFRNYLMGFILDTIGLSPITLLNQAIIVSTYLTLSLIITSKVLSKKIPILELRNVLGLFLQFCYIISIYSLIVLFAHGLGLLLGYISFLSNSNIFDTIFTVIGIASFRILHTLKKKEIKLLSILEQDKKKSEK